MARLKKLKAGGLKSPTGCPDPHPRRPPMLNFLAFFPSHWFLVEPGKWIDDEKLDRFLDEAFKTQPQPGGINETLSENPGSGV
jgi:hypothetical protein